MARPLRTEYEHAVYYVTSRGDRRGHIYEDDGDRNETDRRFLRPALHNRQPPRETTREGNEVIRHNHLFFLRWGAWLTGSGTCQTEANNLYPHHRMVTPNVTLQ